ncbi:hypothetical protein ACVWZK_008465 [Bradyrhizobium sp. GM0.4]
MAISSIAPNVLLLIASEDLIAKLELDRSAGHDATDTGDKEARWPRLDEFNRAGWGLKLKPTRRFEKE